MLFRQGVHIINLRTFSGVSLNHLVWLYYKHLFVLLNFARFYVIFVKYLTFRA